MALTKQAAGEKNLHSDKSIRARWINPRRKRFWAIVVVLLYTLLGFIAVPAFVKSNIVRLIQDDLGRTAHIEKVEFNPYVLSLKVQGFEMDDTDGVRLVAFEEFFVNFQLSSLFRWAWTFHEFRLAGSYFLFERFEIDDTRLSRIASDIAALDPDSNTENKNGGGLPRLLIFNLILSNGRGELKDNIPATPVSLPIGPIDISIQEFNSLPDRYGQQSVNIMLPNNASLHWEGSLSLAPFDSEGELVLKGSHLDNIIAYLEAILPLDSIAAKLSSRFHYRIYTEPDGGLAAQIDGLEIELDEVAISGLSPKTDFLAVQKLSLHGGKLRYPEQTLQFKSLRIHEPRLATWLSENGVLSMNQLVPAAPGETGQMTENDFSWQVSIDELIIENAKLDLEDQSVSPSAQAGLNGIQVKLNGLSNREGEEFPLNLSGNFERGGSFRLEGKLALLPEFSLAGKLSAHAAPLAIAEPYVQQHANILIDAGTLDSEMEFVIPANMQWSAGGSIQIPGMEINDALENKRLVGWEMMDIDRFDLNMGDGSLHISRLLLEQPFARIVVFEDLNTNLSKLEVEKEKLAENAASDPMNLIMAVFVSITVNGFFRSVPALAFRHSYHQVERHHIYHCNRQYRAGYR